MENQKTTTYGDLKVRKAELRNEMNDGGNYDNIGEYRQIIQAIKDAELMLLWSITPDEAYGELEKPKSRRGVKVLVIGSILAILLAIVLSGCIENTMRGAGQTVQGLGQMVTGIGTDVVRGVDGYSKDK